MRTKLLALLFLITVGTTGTLGHVWLSSSNQQPQWTEIDEGLPDYGITTALAFDAFDDNLAYAAVYYKHSVYRSGDGGRTWQLSDQGLEGAPVYALISSPTLPSTVYAGAADGLYVSTDAAHSWQRIQAIPEKPIYALMVPPGRPDRIYAGSFAQMFVSDDAGANWTTFKTGLEGITFLSLASDEKTPGVVLAGTNGSGILQSTDGGATWNQLYNTKAVVSSITVRSKEGLILARAEDNFLRSADVGGKWEGLGLLPDGGRPLNVLSLPGSGQTFLAGSDGEGVYFSADGGSTWHQLGSGLARTRVSALAVDPRNPMRIAAGTTHGVFISYDRGQNWERGSPIGRPIVRGMIQSSDRGRLLVGTTDGVYERAGTGWHLLGQFPKETQILSIATTAESPETLYAGTWSASVQKSTDGGHTWQLSAGNQFSETIIPALVVDPSDSERIYARVEYDRIIKSEDGGESWEPADVGLMDVTVQSLASAPSRPGLLYAGTNKDFYRSVDYGGSWSSTGKVPWSGSTFAINVDPGDPDHVQVGTNGVFNSKDGGKTWSPAAGIEGITVSTLVFSADMKRGFAGTRFQGVYSTEDGGLTWHPFGNGLEDATVNALVLDEKAKSLYAATEEGVFSIDLSGS